MQSARRLGFPLLTLLMAAAVLPAAAQVNAPVNPDALK